MNLQAPLSVLLVDDSAIVRKRLCRLLADEAFVQIVGEAAGALEGLMLYRSRQPQAVVLDLQLPGISGLELLQRIKQRTPDCQVIILTNYSGIEVRDACLGLGADYVLHKASEFEQIVAILRRVSCAATHFDAPGCPLQRLPAV